MVENKEAAEKMQKFLRLLRQRRTIRPDDPFPEVTKIATILQKICALLKSLLHEPLKLFFKTKGAKVAQNCSSQSHLTLVR